MEEGCHERKKANRLISIVILTLFAFVSVSPLVLVLVNSFKTHVDITRDPLSIIFSAGIDNYIKAWHDGNFGTTLPNSIILTGSTVVIVLISAFWRRMFLRANACAVPRLYSPGC